MSGAIAAPMLLTSVMPKSTTLPMDAEVIAISLPLSAINAPPAPVTVHCAYGGLVFPNSKGYLYCRSADEK